MKSIVLLFMFSCSISVAQTVTTVFDAHIMGEHIANHAVTLTALNPMVDDIEDTDKHRKVIASQMGVIHQIKDGIYRSMFEVSAVIKSGSNVVNAKRIIQDIARYQSDMIEYARGNPKLVLVAVKSEAALIDRTVSLGLYINENVLKGGDSNLLNAEQRMDILRHIIRELKIMRGIAYGVSRRMRLASRTGVLKVLNPFGLAYPNRDLQIVKTIVNDL